MNTFLNRQRPSSPVVLPAAASGTAPSSHNGSAKAAAGPRNWKRIGLIAAAVVGGIVLLTFAGKSVVHSLHTVSTDDAYVNSYVTFVAPRVTGQVTEVLVEDNNRVKKGDVLVRLDPEPFRIQVETAQAALDVAQANFQTA